MSRQSFKELYECFRHWQRDPVRYVNSEEEHRCNNCGFTFTGNYCPCCSQRAGVGHIGWKSVRMSLMDIWGLGTRSFLYSAWQLLLRPGYFISDYINGKRQVSFPPVKMLFILAVAYALIFHWLFPDFKALGFGVDFSELGLSEGEEQQAANMVKPFYDWYETHFSWVMLILSFIAIFPTWVMFRYSPRNTRHSLPEGFFIQVFFADLQVTLCLLSLPFWFFCNQMAIVSVSTLVVMAYYIISYKQLFGYSLWGTLWRQAFVFGFIYCFALVLAFLVFDMGLPTDMPVAPGRSINMKSFYIGCFGIFGIVIMTTGYLINRLATRKARRQQ